MSIIGAFGIAGRFITGWMLDRFFAPRVGMALLFMTAAGLLLLSRAHSLTEGILAGALIGFSMGGETDVAPFLLAKYFGLRNLGTLYGLTWTAYAVAAAMGSVLLGRAFDSTGSYVALLLRFSFMTFVAGLLMIAMPRYPASTQLEQEFTLHATHTS